MEWKINLQWGEQLINVSYLMNKIPSSNSLNKAERQTIILLQEAAFLNFYAPSASLQHPTATPTPPHTPFHSSIQLSQEESYLMITILCSPRLSCHVD